MSVFGFLFFFLILSGAPKALAAGSPDDGGYEIDYEEEVEESESSVEEAPVRKPTQPATRTKTAGGGPAVQGSRAKNRFAPILKSETRSVYKKDGKTLDVDTD